MPHSPDQPLTSVHAWNEHVERFEGDGKKKFVRDVSESEFIPAEFRRQALLADETDEQFRLGDSLSDLRQELHARVQTR